MSETILHKLRSRALALYQNCVGDAFDPNAIFTLHHSPDFKVDETSALLFFAEHCTNINRALMLPNVAAALNAAAPEEQKFHACSIGAVHNKDEMLGLIAYAHHIITNDGYMMLGIPNDWGAKSIEKSLRDAYATIDLDTKHKGRIFLIHKASLKNEALLLDWLKQSMARPLAPHGLMTMPGLFGWNKIDEGSALLIETLKENQINLSGKCADFGCGYGFLSQQLLLEDHHTLTELRFIDHDARAVLLCLENIGPLAKQKNVQPKPHWADLSKPQTIGETPFDAIIMNPPFHAQKQQQNTLGLRFIENAAKNLKNNGILYMVANRHLPYEKLLTSLFSKVEILKEQNGFKVIMAIQ